MGGLGSGPTNTSLVLRMISSRSHQWQSTSNDTRSLHVAQMVRDALRNINVPIANAEVFVLEPLNERT